MNKGLINWLTKENPDIVCLQEIKALEEQINISEFESIGFKYNFWYSATKKVIVEWQFYQNMNQFM